MDRIGPNVAFRHGRLDLGQDGARRDLKPKSSRIEPPGCYQFDSRGDSRVVIEPKHGDGRAADAGNPNKPRPIPAEVLVPDVMPRVKQARELASVRFNAGNIRPLVQIASAAAQREVLRLGCPAMLSGDDMIHDVTEGRGGLGESAVFAAMARSIAHFAFELAVHRTRDQAAGTCWRRDVSALAFSIVKKSLTFK